MSGGDPRGATRVLLHFRVPGKGDPEAVEELVRAYHESSKALLGTPGLLGNALLRNAQEPTSFAVLSEWEDRHAFLEWEQGALHKGQTAPMRAFADPSPPSVPFAVYDVVADYSG